MGGGGYAAPLSLIPKKILSLVIFSKDFIPLADKKTKWEPIAPEPLMRGRSLRACGSRHTTTAGKAAYIPLLSIARVTLGPFFVFISLADIFTSLPMTVTLSHTRPHTGDPHEPQ